MPGYDYDMIDASMQVSQVEKRQTRENSVSVQQRGESINLFSRLSSYHRILKITDWSPVYILRVRRDAHGSTKSSENVETRHRWAKQVRVNCQNTSNFRLFISFTLFHSKRKGQSRV